MKREMKKIALINLSSIPKLKIRSVYPIGLTCISSYLKKYNYCVDIIDFLNNEETYYSMSFLDKDFDFIGISIRNMEIDEIAGESYFEEYKSFLKDMINIINEKKLKCQLFIGGAGYSVYHKYIKEEEFNMTSIVGNGEEWVLDFIEGRLDKKKYTNKCNDFFEQLDIIYDEELVKNYVKYGIKDFGMNEIGIPTHRGKCVEKCLYCAYKNIDASSPVYRNLDLIKKNIIDLYNMGVRDIFFSDSLFNEDIEYAKKICQLLIDLGYHDLGWKAYFSMNLDKQFITMLKKSNCTSALISCDTFSKKMVQNLKKNFNLETVIKNITLLRDAELTFKIFVLFGGPGEDEKTVKETCTFINKYLNKEELLISVGIRILPNTSISKGYVKNNLLDMTFYPVKKEIILSIIKYMNKDKITFANMWRLLISFG